MVLTSRVKASPVISLYRNVGGKMENGSYEEEGTLLVLPTSGISPGYNNKPFLGWEPNRRGTKYIH